MAVLKEGVVGGAMNLYFIYKFLRILTTPFASTDAFKLGIIDEKGKILIKKSKLKSIEEKEAYTMFDRLVWKLKRLLEKISFGKTRIASYAAALWLIKEENNFNGTDKELQESFLSFLETDWKNEALILKENYEGDMDKKTFGNLRQEGIDIKKASMKDVIKDFQSSDAPQFKGKSDKKKKEMAIAAKLSTEEFEDEGYGGTKKWKKGQNKMKKSGVVLHRKDKSTGYVEEVEVDEVLVMGKAPKQMKSADFFKMYKKLKSKQNIKIWFDSTLAKGTKWREFKVGRISVLKNGVGKITLQQGDRPSGVKYFLYNRDGRVSLAMGDMGVSMTAMKEEVAPHAKVMAKKGDSADAIKKMHPEITDDELKDLLGEKHGRPHPKKKMKFKLKQFKHLKPKKKKKEHGSYSRFSDTSGGFAFSKPKGGSGYVGAYNSAELDGAEIKEKKSATGYELYHKDFSSAMQHAYDFAKSKGHIVDPKEIDDKVATGPKKPSSGKVNRYSLKAGRKKVEIQVTNLDNKRYELNMYIEGLEEAKRSRKDELKYQAALADFKKKGGKIKKDKPGPTFKSLFKQKGPKKAPRSEEIEEARRMSGPVADYMKFAKGQGPNPNAVLDVTSVNKWAAEIKKGIKAGWISVEPSSLGGEYNIAIMIKLTLEKEKDWPHKILHNASFGMIRIDTDGGMEMFASGHKVKNMRKTKVKSARDVVSKINTWIKKVEEGFIPFSKFITEGRPKQDKDYVPGATDRDLDRSDMWKKLADAQQKHYTPQDIQSIARKYKQRVADVQGGKTWDWTWLITLMNGIKLDYDYGSNTTTIKKWKLDKKKIEIYLSRYRNEHETIRDLKGDGNDIQVVGLETAFELIEGVELKEEFWAVIDKAKGGEVMAVTSDEKDAKSSVKMSNFSKHDYHFGKDPRTLKIVKVMGKHSQKKAEKMIGTKLSYKEEVEEDAPANSVAGGNVNLDPFVKKKRKNAKVVWEMFGGQKVFVVSPERFYDSRLGKARYARYEKYVGNDKLGEAIRQYGRNNPKNAIILKNSGNGAMLYLKYGRN